MNISSRVHTNWKSTILFSLKIISLDVLWTIPLAIIGLIFILEQMIFPSYSLCLSLKEEAGSEFNTSISKHAAFIDICVKMIIYTLPLALCILLVENRFQFMHKKWWKIIKITMVCIAIDMVYRSVVILVYVHPIDGREGKEYPKSYNFGSHVIWLVSACVIVVQVSNLWTSKHIATLVINHNMPHQDLQSYSRPVKKSLKNALLLSLVATALCGILIRFLKKSLR